MNRRSFLGMAAVAVMSIPVFAGTTNVTTLTAEQKYSLLFMYQEEKMARDVYITLGKKYPNASTFSNIVLSEQAHMDSVEKLCIKYGVNISNINEGEVGVFVLEDLQKLYNTLVAQGLVSLEEGLKVGVAIEKTDIADLLVAQIGMPKDVVTVFENLRQGSYSHLDAFTQALAALK